jgi:hypothetical protein
VSDGRPPRWKRRSHRSEWHIDTINITSWASFEGIEAYWLNKGHGLSAPDLCFVQELARTSDQTYQVEKSAFGSGWNTVVVPSVATVGATGLPGKSAGVAILAQRPRGLLAYGDSPGIGPPPFPGRVAAALWPAVLSRGVLVISVYLFCSEGMSSRNIAIMEYVLLLTKVARCPFIIGGDFNISPSCMDAAGFPQQLGGTIVAPCEDTYVSGGFSSLVDFFIIHNGIAAQTTVCRIDVLAPVAKHSPVRISIRADLKSVLTRQITKPAPYPKAAPICCRQDLPVDRALVELVQQTLDEAPSLPPEAMQDRIDQAYGSWTGAAEANIDSLFGIGRAPGASRTSGYRTCLKPVLGLGCRNQTGDPLSFSLRKVIALAAIFRCQYDHCWKLALRAQIRALCIVPDSAHRCLWIPVRRSIHLWLRLSAEAFEIEISILTGWAAWLEDAAAKRRAAHWKNWSKEALTDSSGRSVYALIKGPQPIPRLIVPDGPDGAIRAGTFAEVVEARAVPWSRLWKIDDGYKDPFPIDHPIILDAGLIFPPVVGIKQLARTYRWNTSVGVDHWPPRMIGLIDDWLLQVLCHLIRLLVITARTPRHFHQLLVHLIPKTDGGDRPIGVYPTIIRIISRWFRRAYGAVWQAKQPAIAHWGIRDRSIDHGVWRLAAFMEWCRATGRSSASFFLDIAKAFENIEHDTLVKLARQASFSEALLRWVIHLYRFPRSVVFLGSLAEPVRATKTVVPGDSFADLMMRIMITPMIKVLRRLCPSCLPAIVVDDIQCLIHDMNPVTVGRVTAQLLEISVQTLEDELHLPVSKPKLMSIFSGPEVQRIACSRSKLVARSVCPAVRNLGVDFSASGCKSRKVRGKRMTEMKKRAFRLRRLNRSARSRRFLSNGIGAVAVFGGGITGFTRSDLQSLRSSFRSCLRDKVAGRSLAWDLHRSSCDPALQAIGMAVKLFLVGWHESLIPKNFVRTVLVRIGRLPATLSSEGPVAAFVKTISMLGWEIVGNHSLRICAGRTIALDDFLPWEASLATTRAVNRTLWLQAAKHRAIYQHLDHPPYISGVVAATKHCSPREACLVDGFMAGVYSGTCHCQCGNDFDDEQRLWWHVWWDCPITDMYRREFVPSSISGPARKNFSPWMATGLFHHPMIDFPPSSSCPRVVWCSRNIKSPVVGCPLFGCESFSDGSTLRPNCKWSARAGWAVVQINSDGTLGISAFGCLPIFEQDNNAAEIWAILFWLQHLDPCVRSAVLYSDSQIAVDGFGDLLLVSRADQPYASIWRSILDAVSEVGGVALRVVKVPAHISVEAAAARGPAGLHRRAGNRWADLLAKAGAARHPDGTACHTRKARIDGLLAEIIPWFGRCLRVLVDTGMLPSRPPPSKYGRVPKLRRHLVVAFSAGQDRCCRCLRVGQGGVVPGACIPHTARPHHLCTVPGGVYCSVCGAYSFTRTFNLAMSCTGPPKAGNSAGYRSLARLGGGLHPITRRPLGAPPEDLCMGCLEVDLSSVVI